MQADAGGSGRWRSAREQVGSRLIPNRVHWTATVPSRARERNIDACRYSQGVSEDLKVVTTVANAAEAEMVAERLSEAGIAHSSRVASGGIRLGAAAARDVYVDARDYDRAVEALEIDEGFSEEELARLSERAGEEAGEP